MSQAVPTFKPYSRFWPCLLVLTGVGLAFGFDGERPMEPDGQVVPAAIHFFIDASGKPQPNERYLIEIATDNSFENIVKQFDMRKDQGGWAVGDESALKDVPEDMRPKGYHGIHFRSRNTLQDGEYFWRVSKAVGDAAWQPIDGRLTFRVDTTPPAAVDNLKLRIQKDGSLLLMWGSVARDANDNPELVRGYRVYRFDKLLKRYPVMTRYLLAELDGDTSVAIPKDQQDSAKISFFFVQAVDDVGNEVGRRMPQPIGTMDVAFNPPNLDQLTDPAYIKKLNEEAREREKRR